MRVRSFYGSSVKEALGKARAELGPEAAIVASRQLRPEEGSGCEVVCGVPGSESEKQPAPATAPVPGEVKPRDNRVARIRKGLQAVRSAVVATPSRSNDDAELEAVRETLLSNGFSDALTTEIMSGVRGRVRKTDGAIDALRAELSERLPFTASTTSRRKGQRSAITLVGPGGSGKTTTIVKLAITLGLAARRPIRIISADGGRIGGSDALRTYAAAMGVPCDVVETPADLAAALSDTEGRGLLLIDTPGFTPADENVARGFAAVLSGHPDVDVHLVVPACWSTRAMAAAAARFRPFLPSALLITNVDHTDTLLPVAALSLELERPISWVCGGQSIPEDLLEGSADLILGGGKKEPVRLARVSGAA